jgi:hypothetical protein
MEERDEIAQGRTNASNVVEKANRLAWTLQLLRGAGVVTEGDH